MVKAIRRWMGMKPIACQLCNRRFNATEDAHFYDFKNTIDGKWGLGCDPCFKRYGIGLGTGKGQKYNFATLKKEDG